MRDESFHVVVFGTTNEDITPISSAIRREVPRAEVKEFIEPSDFFSYLEEGKCEVAVLKGTHLEGDLFTFLKRVHLTASGPSIVFIADELNPQLMFEVYEHGGGKYVVADETWLQRLPPTIRTLLRNKRLADENNYLISRLTDANRILEEKNRRLDQFSATVAHDIRGPLAGIAMKLEYLLDTYQDSFNERVQKLMLRALESSGRLTRIVQAMYEFAKLGSKAAQMGEVKISSVVEDILVDLHYDESVDVEVTLGELPVVWGNYELLTRLFQNLIANAVKYCDKTPTKIRIGEVGKSEEALAHFTHIEITDNGPGIPYEEQEELFTMFRRGSMHREDSRGEKGQEGLGIGLAVVERIVDLHYGQIKLHSVPGQGTQFILHLPVEKISFTLSE